MISIINATASNRPLPLLSVSQQPVQRTQGRNVKAAHTMTNPIFSLTRHWSLPSGSISIPDLPSHLHLGLSRGHFLFRLSGHNQKLEQLGVAAMLFTKSCVRDVPGSNLGWDTLSYLMFPSFSSVPPCRYQGSVSIKQPLRSKSLP